MLMTLYSSETYFAETEQNLCLMEDYLSHQSISKELFKMEIESKFTDMVYKGYILS
jgi:putative hydrolase of the HAD superfamily